MAHAVVITEDITDIVEVGSLYGGSSGGGAGAFILDVTASGVVGDKMYATEALVTCSTDVSDVRVHIGCEGGADAYTPSAEVNGVVVVLSESATKRWFVGYADITLAGAGPNLVTVAASSGGASSATITRLASGPEVKSVVFGAYPGTQTELKAGDTLLTTIHTDPTATAVTISAGAVASMPPLPVVNGVATGMLVIGVSNGLVNFTVSARNAFGTYGEAFTTPLLTLNQKYPVLSAFAVTYPNGHAALNASETATVACTVTDADTVTYTTPGFTVAPGYEAVKGAISSLTGYVASGTNYAITANRAANDATTTGGTLVKIATVAPTAYVTAPARMASSPTGLLHEVRIYPSQTLSATPVLAASVGTWQGSWTNAGGYWSRSLRITDADLKGTGVFSALGLVGLSGIAGSTLTSGANYVVGGISSRILTFTAFSRTAAIGCAVGDQTKTSADIVGGDVLTRYTGTTVVTKGYYIANAGGTYDPNGGYLGLSDTALVGANTSGTLQASFAEAA